MIEVNPWFIDSLLSPITGLGDDDSAVALYRKMNVTTEEQYREIINKKFVDYFNGLSDRNKNKTKLALSYYLTTNKIDFERVFESCLPPFDPPQCARDFFVWLWEELFRDEEYLISDLSPFQVNSNIHEPNRP